MPNNKRLKKPSSYATGGRVKKKKYALGSPVPYSPDVAIMQDQINQAKAQLAASTDPTATGLNLFGAIASKVGGSLMAKGIDKGQGADGKGLEGFLNKNQGSMQSVLGLLQGMTTDEFAMGGVAQKVNINAEGKEIVQAPGGDPMELVGASHNNGGIDLAVPEGTEIYSQRLKGPDGRTMAARKKARENKESSLGKTLQNAPTDKLLRNAFSRTKQANAVVDAQDMNKMKVAQMMDELGQAYATGGPVKKYAIGGTVPKPAWMSDPILDPTRHLGEGTLTDADLTASLASQYTPSVKPTPITTPAVKETSALTDIFNTLGDATKDITFGDALGLYGQYKASTDPMKNTLKQRSLDQPNINAYKDYGKRGLNEIEKAKGFLAGQKASGLKSIVSDQVAASSRNRAGARGINTLRALDIATDAQAQKAKEAVNNQYSQMLSSLFEKTSGLYNQQDQMFMQGEDKRIAADLADRDAYYTALAKDIATRNTGTQYIAKNINEIKTRKTTGELINKLSANFDVDPMTGKVTKNGVSIGNVGDFELEPGTGKIIHKKTKKEVKNNG